VNSGFVDLGVSEDTVNWVGGRSEEILAKFLETGTGDRGVEVDTLEERVDFDGGLGGGRQGTLSTLACSAETTESTSICGEILKILLVHVLETFETPQVMI
jgi:hypothetical protein